MKYLSDFEPIFDGLETGLESLGDKQLISYFKDVQELTKNLDSLVDLTVKGQILDDELESDILSEYGFNLTSSLKKGSINLFTKRVVHDHFQVVYGHCIYLIDELTLRDGPYLGHLRVKNHLLNAEFKRSLVDEQYNDFVNKNIIFYESIANKDRKVYKLINYSGNLGNKLRGHLLNHSEKQLLIDSRKMINILSSKPRVMELFEEYVKISGELVDESRELIDKASKRFIQESFYDQLLKSTFEKPRNDNLYI